MSWHLALTRVRGALERYRFTAIHESDLQRQVTEVLGACDGIRCENEVIAERGRYDILVVADGARVVLELKVRGSVAEVERQAQRYALTDGIDAVAVVTSSQRLAAQLRASPRTLGGKPFEVIGLRSF